MATTEQIERVRDLVAMWRGIPERLVDLNFWHEDQNAEKKPAIHRCGTHACLAGWACLYPPFIEQGLSFGRVGSTWEPSYQGKFWFDALDGFFGDGLALFSGRRLGRYDGEIFACLGRDISDHRLAEERCLAWLREQGVAA